MSTFRFQILAPSPALSPFVELIWAVRGAAPWSGEVVLPNGAVELMVNFGPTQQVVGYGDRTASDEFRHVWIAGIQDQPLGIASPQGADHMGVRFRPGGAHAFFGVPMDELHNRVVDLDLLVGRAAADLRDRLGARPDLPGRAAVLEAWLLERRYGVHPYFATARRALDLIHQSGFRTSVSDVCERLGLSNRHLIEQFRGVVGLPPKTMARVARFGAVLREIDRRQEADWARLAARFAFADQSHLIREFRRFGGVTPRQFLARRTPEQSHLLQA